MKDPRHTFLLHATIARDGTLAMDLEMMRALGYDGLEASAAKMRAFLAAGWSREELAARLQPVNIPAMGFLIDIERQGAARQELRREAEEIFELARLAGARAVQVLTGPVDVDAVLAHRQGRASGLYAGVLGLPRDEQIAVTAQALREVADLAAESGLLVYLESLGWSPLNTIADQLELIGRANRDNIRLVVDFWHCHVAGDTPDVIARLDAALLYGVHVCDSRPFTGGVPIERELRDVPTGQGCLDLRAWTDAVKSTGYVGWWSAELFCRRQHQDDSFRVAGELRQLLAELVQR